MDFPYSFSFTPFTATGFSAPVNTMGAGTFAIQVKYTSNPSVVVVDLQGSLNDGRDWFLVGTWTTVSQTNGDIVWIVDKPVQMLRAKLTTLTGGTTPSVAVYCASSG